MNEGGLVRLKTNTTCSSGAANFSGKVFSWAEKMENGDFVLSVDSVLHIVDIQIDVFWPISYDFYRNSSAETVSVCNS